MYGQIDNKVKLLTNNRPSDQSKGDGHTGASGLVASLSPNRPVCVLAYEVKGVYQPKQGGREK